MSKEAEEVGYIELPLEDAADVYLQHIVQQPDRYWRSGLFDCFNDCSSCCMGTWCLPCLFGSNAKMIQAFNGVPEEYQSCCAPCCNYYLSSCLPAFMVSFLAAIVGVPPMGLDVVAARWGVGKYAGTHRTLIRAKYGIVEDTSDFVAHCLCSPCATCQEAREIKAEMEDLKVQEAMMAPEYMDME
eukprot:CAMPEP_0197846832 /NCGR_PEP_ID=MMETSP1438-20131217/4546_1 /TAXON_ID=1461541 /ORGANISM="Pterosperma sp., Strain CCMP1384" /LENGTH=184 /DNA_ID=CAMNT_0043458607 /DNA_START=79 /DNA_END=633 /DNA_ORIENTATION=+